MSKPAHLQMVGARDAGYQDGADFYQTPPIATQKLLEVWKPKGIIWEPACGAGAISKVLKDEGYRVISTDLNDQGFGYSPVNFLDCDEPLAHTIITNPPYNIANEFVEHCLKLVPQSAFLMRLVWLEGSRRFERIFSKYPLEKVLVFSKRIPRMHREGYTGPTTTSTIAFAWFIFNNDYGGPPQLSWL